MLMNVCCVNGCTMKVTRKVAFFGIEQNANELITTPCTSVFCCQTFHTADKHFFVPLTFKRLQIFSDGLHCHLAGNDSIKTSLVEKFVCFFEPNMHLPSATTFVRLSTMQNSFVCRLDKLRTNVKTEDEKSQRKSCVSMVTMQVKMSPKRETKHKMCKTNNKPQAPQIKSKNTCHSIGFSRDTKWPCSVFKPKKVLFFVSLHIQKRRFNVPKNPHVTILVNVRCVQ